MKRHAEVYFEPHGSTDVKASNKPSLHNQTTLKDHYRVVKPRNDAIELTKSPRVNPTVRKAVLAGDEVDNPPSLGFDFSTGSLFPAVTADACSSPAWPFSCCLEPSAATVTDRQLQETHHTPAASKCGISISTLSCDAGATDDDASTCLSFELTASSNNTAVVDTPKLFLNAPSSSLPPSTATGFLSAAASSSRMQDTIRRATAAAQLVDCAVFIGRQPAVTHSAATPAASISRGTCSALASAVSLQEGSTDSFRSWLPVCPSFGAAGAADSYLEDDCRDDAFSREPAAVVTAKTGAGAVETIVSNTSKYSGTVTACCVVQKAHISQEDLVHGSDNTDSAAQPDQQRPSNNSIKLAMNSATAEYQSRYQELLYGMIYMEESRTSEDCCSHEE